MPREDADLGGGREKFSNANANLLLDVSKISPHKNFGSAPARAGYPSKPPPPSPQGYVRPSSISKWVVYLQYNDILVYHRAEY